MSLIYSGTDGDCQSWLDHEHNHETIDPQFGPHSLEYWGLLRCLRWHGDFVHTSSERKLWMILPGRLVVKSRFFFQRSRNSIRVVTIPTLRMRRWVRHYYDNQFAVLIVQWSMSKHTRNWGTESVSFLEKCLRTEAIGVNADVWYATRSQLNIQPWARSRDENSIE